MSKLGLGKGLDSLIPVEMQTSSAGAADGKRIFEIPVERIHHAPDQPRKVFDEDALTELAASIREHGILLPLVVRKDGDEFEIIAGERRFRAAQEAGLRVVPAMIREVSDQEQFELALIENIQREDLNPVEEAKAYFRLSDEFGLKHDEIAQKVGKSRSVISNLLRLLQLSEDMQQALMDERISMSHARILVGISEEEARKDFFEKILNEKLSVANAEQHAKIIEVKHHLRQKHFDPAVMEYEERLREALGTGVKIKKSASDRGVLLIEFYSLEDLKNLLGIILPSDH